MSKNRPLIPWHNHATFHSITPSNIIMYSFTCESEDNNPVVTVNDNCLKQDLPYEPPRLSLRGEHKQAWAAENLEVHNAWQDQFKWILWALRICLRFPYSINPKGQFEIKYQSIAFLHWITVYAIYFSLTTKTVLVMINKILTESTDNVKVMMYGYNIAVALYAITYPGSLAKEFRSLAESINKWPAFEELCRKQLSMPIQLKNQLLCQVGVLLILPSSALIVYAVSDLIFCIHWVTYVFTVMVVSSANYMVLYWIVSVNELSRIGEMIKHRISEDLCSLEEKYVDAAQIRDLRMAWLELTVMIKLNANSWSYIFTYLALTLCIVIIMSSFASISLLVNENRFEFGLLVVALSAAATAYWMFEYGHRLTNKTGCEICETLGNVNILYMDAPAKEEVKFFTKVVKMNYPSVSLGGVLIANRAAMTSMVSSIITNLIVILQLPKDMSLVSKPTNYTYV